MQTTRTAETLISEVCHTPTGANPDTEEFSMERMGGALSLPDTIKASICDGEIPILCVTIEPGGGCSDVLTSDLLQAILEAHGAQDWFVDQEQIRFIGKEQLSLAAAKTYRVAERRDAQVRIQIEGDPATARITLVPAAGGEPVTAEKIQNALKKAGVTFGILETKIPDLVAKGSCEKELIAQSSPPMPGTDVSFQRLIKESDHKGQPKTGEDGKVDLHDLGLFISVAKGTPLIRRIPPSPEIPGVAIDGNPLSSKKSRDHNLSAGTGTALSTADPNVLIAVMDGLAIFKENSARIVGKLELNGIGCETGNVEFIGSILIRGAIQPGFNAKADGDIIVGETVGASDLTAGGSIQLRCGAFGRGKNHITAKGNIKARFLSDSTVYCGGNVEVEDLIANCTIICEGMVEVGQRSGKGQIYGGRILATKGIRARILGSVTEIDTAVEVSPLPTLAARERAVVKEINDLERKSSEAGRSLSYLQGSPTGRKDPRMERLGREFQALRQKIEALRLESEELTAKLHVHFDAKITASQVFPGVTVSIGRKKEVIVSPMEHFVFEPAPE